ncbi:MAG: aminotransferase class I/II-fold pyridoxal phosphate-dependent enzyme [Bdellovibrionales bacterium]
MTGWRLGWALGPDPVIAAMNKYQSQSVSCACSFSIAAGVQAINEGEPELKEAVALLKTRRDFVYSELSKIEGIEVEAPQGAFYIWPNVSQFLGKKFNGNVLKTTKDFSSALLEDQMVVAVPGVEFGLDGYLRISYALEQTRMQEAIDRIANFISKIQ